MNSHVWTCKSCSDPKACLSEARDEYPTGEATGAKLLTGATPLQHDASWHGVALGIVLMR